MILINILCYILYLILCLLIIFIGIQIYDFIFNKKYLNDIKLKKIQTIVISLSLFATIIKFFIEIQEKYILISDKVALIIIIVLLFVLLCIVFIYYFKYTHKIQKRKHKQKNR